MAVGGRRMARWLWVLLPFLAQAGVVAAVVLATQGGGSFVGLAALLSSVLALPLTALFNALAVRRQPPLHPLVLGARVLYTTLAYPVLLVIGAALAN